MSETTRQPIKLMTEADWMDLYTQATLALGFLKGTDGEAAARLANGLEAALSKARGESPDRGNMARGK